MAWKIGSQEKVGQPNLPNPNPKESAHAPSIAYPGDSPCRHRRQSTTGHG